MDIFSGVAVAKQAYDLVKILKESRDQSVIDKAAGALREKITELQMLNAELSGLFHAERQITVELREENTKINMFTTQSSEYEIHKTSGGAIVYILKSTPKGEIPHHYLCAHCYQNRIISILQPTKNESGFHMSYCPECKNEYRMDKIIIDYEAAMPHSPY
ncbi:hypothetical protein SGGMMB4_01725 [Sodalis glossinidius str. 'morsitans']|uniref:Uncharacterized protein n=1 Tax=Sodalis glossinidius (strain morsitans) TaxID=343509 RepID=A0A193QHD5_SODGM|nr:hypothetical protein [Sodalis glossinidius]CRL44566.1 hypothetical protein SGGMMB4_01725 [Sodalis glossinidius str. 'morsitans']